MNFWRLWDMCAVLSAVCNLNRRERLVNTYFVNIVWKMTAVKLKLDLQSRIYIKKFLNKCFLRENGNIIPKTVCCQSGIFCVVFTDSKINRLSVFRPLFLRSLLIFFLKLDIHFLLYLIYLQKDFSLDGISFLKQYAGSLRYFCISTSQ